MVPWPGTKVYELAKKGRGGYTLMEGDNFSHFHKHFGGALRFDNFSITYLKWMRIWGYFIVYASNKRLLELFQFFTANFKPGVLLLKDLLPNLRKK